jgi:hypothetical protein
MHHQRFPGSHPETGFSHLACGGGKAAILTGANTLAPGGLLTGSYGHRFGAADSALIPPLLLAA